MRAGAPGDGLGPFRTRILDDLLPAFCTQRDYDVAGFKDTIDRVEAIDAANFLFALEKGLVRPLGRLYRAPRSAAGEQFFWDHGRATDRPRPISLWIEPIITVATLTRLHRDFSWPKDLLGTQSQDWAFDVTVFASTTDRREHVAGEIKKTAREVDVLVDLMTAFGSRRPADEGAGRPQAGQARNAFRKVEALRARNAPWFWAIGPGRYGFVFRMSYPDDGRVLFHKAAESDLRCPASVSFSDPGRVTTG